MGKDVVGSASAITPANLRKVLGFSFPTTIVPADILLVLEALNLVNLQHYEYNWVTTHSTMCPFQQVTSTKTSMVWRFFSRRMILGLYSPLDNHGSSTNHIFPLNIDFLTISILLYLWDI
jgi:hypothetical protein